MTVTEPPSLEGVTICAPCSQGTTRPESHAAETRILLADRCPVAVPHEDAARALAYAVRTGLKVSGPLTVHQCPSDDINLVTGQTVREWIATQP